jgi:thymidylate synthase ThyX
MAQIHKKFTNSQVKELVQRYVSKEIERKYIQEVLGIKKRRFFALLKKFREFAVKPPYESVKDIFCQRIDRTIDTYRKISINNLQLKVNNGTPRETVNLRIYPCLMVLPKSDSGLITNLSMSNG